MKSFNLILFFSICLLIISCENDNISFNKDHWKKASQEELKDDLFPSTGYWVRDKMKIDLIENHLNNNLDRNDIIGLLGKPLENICCFHRWINSSNVGLDKNSSAFKMYGDSLSYFDTSGRFDYKKKKVTNIDNNPLMRYYVGYSPSGKNLMIIVLDRNNKYLDVLFQEAI